MPTGVIIALVIGGVLLVLGIMLMALFAFRGQQTGTQKTQVGVADANFLKGTHVRTYVAGGATPFLNAAT